MHCLLAILLLAADQARDNDRLAVMGLDRNNGHYEIYNADGRRQFRGVETGSDIMIAARPTDGPGTYMAVYCSPSKSLRYLGRYITKDTKKLDDISNYGFHQDITKERRCLDVIKQKLKLPSNRRGLHISELFHLDCSKSTIYSLAFQNNFCIQDIKGQILTPCRRNHRRIGVDNLFLMSDVVMGRRFILKIEANGLHTALAWYQGYLNIFQKGKLDTTWHPMIQSVPKIDNYYRITEFIANSFVEIGSIKSALTQDEITIISTSTDDQRLKSSNYPAEESHIKEQLQILSQKALRLNESPAHGLIGPFIE
ncbi:BgTH12-01098 [Blumeria graminis f. sp. triticale]|uniref:BgTH12-01098 n=1 Tax=Blumeria graminis f. sp. triticale TaxID=1689686 RepID=A0A9W4D7C1_BLUGR|nr:BgTH12-01098 [Blumeria graminis f. sp. triticale]